MIHQAGMLTPLCCCRLVRVGALHGQASLYLHVQVKQGFEPSTFRCHFLGWNPNLWAQNESYEDYKKSVTSGVTSVQKELEVYDESRKLSYQELKGNPPGIDLTKKEVHDFALIHGCIDLRVILCRTT